MTRVTHDPIQRPKVKVTRLNNAVTENQPYLRNRKAYELQTRYTQNSAKAADVAKLLLLNKSRVTYFPPMRSTVVPPPNRNPHAT